MSGTIYPLKVQQTRRLESSTASPRGNFKFQRVHLITIQNVGTLLIHICIVGGMELQLINLVFISGTDFMQSFMKHYWMFTKLLLGHLHKCKHAF
jgi:hypothetical protein